jgi:hypothetical protein
MEKIQKILPNPFILLMLIFSFIILYGNGAGILQDPDMGWHIAAGDLIRSLGHIPMQDSWSFLSSEQVWYNLSWLWDIVLSVVHEKTGLEGFFVFANFLPALLVALLLLSISSRGEIGINALIFTGLITTYCLLEFATGRPQVIAMMLALAFHHILHHSRSNPETKQLYLLPVLMALWANIHGSFIAGFIVLGAYGLEAIYHIIKLRSSGAQPAALNEPSRFAPTINIGIDQKKWLQRMAIVGVACIFALLANPYGVNVVDGVLRTLDSVITAYIFEWQPFVFGSFMGTSLWLLVFVLFANFRNDNIPLADKILAILWFVAMLFSARNIGFLAVLAAPFLAFNFPADNIKDSNTRKISTWINNKKYSPALVFLILVILFGSYKLLPVLGADHYIEDTAQSPLPAMNYVMKHYAGKRMLNDWNYGGRMIYESKGKFPVMLDGRSGSAYSEKQLSDYL